MISVSSYRWRNLTCCGSLATLLLWLGSGGFWFHAYIGGTVRVRVNGGIVHIERVRFSSTTGVAGGLKEFELRAGHLPSFDPLKLWTNTASSVAVPLSVVFALSVIPAGFFWLFCRRRPPPGHCQTCGYNLTGNESGRCPECGTEVQK